jgi:hypothetical protein
MCLEGVVLETHVVRCIRRLVVSCVGRSHLVLITRSGLGNWLWFVVGGGCNISLFGCGFLAICDMMDMLMTLCCWCVVVFCWSRAIHRRICVWQFTVFPLMLDALQLTTWNVWSPHRNFHSSVQWTWANYTGRWSLCRIVCWWWYLHSRGLQDCSSRLVVALLLGLGRLFHIPISCVQCIMVCGVVSLPNCHSLFVGSQCCVQCCG